MSDLKIHNEAEAVTPDVTVSKDSPEAGPVLPPVQNIVYVFQPFDGLYIPLPVGKNPPCFFFRFMAAVLLGWKWVAVIR